MSHLGDHSLASSDPFLLVNPVHCERDLPASKSFIKVLSTKNCGLRIGTRLIRQSPVYGDIDCDVVIYFEPSTYIDAATLDYYDLQLNFLSAEFDEAAPDDAPGPLTEAELTKLRDWLIEHHEEACEIAKDDAANCEFV